MELEGTLMLDRPPTRRWVSVVAVVVPVVVFVVLAAWFIRVYVAPPMVAIPAPTVLAAAPPPEPGPVQAEPAAPSAAKPVPVEQPATPVPTPVPAAEAPEHAPTLPMIASLAAAPPALTVGIATTAFANLATDRSQTDTAAVGAIDSGATETSQPVAQPVPLPPSKPRLSVALVSGPVPLPRPRPTEPSPAPEIIPFDRHAVD